MWEGSMLAGAVALSAVLLDWMHRDELDARRDDARQAREAARGSRLAAEPDGG